MLSMIPLPNAIVELRCVFPKPRQTLMGTDETWAQPPQPNLFRQAQSQVRIDPMLASDCENESTESEVANSRTRHVAAHTSTQRAESPRRAPSGLRNMNLPSHGMPSPDSRVPARRPGV
ncbi:hypothetical protein LIA77_09674 [Sarocladium implicatum]|nr:hypothetical protein LIA77_09674 [Sarocladium implicatum]